MARATRLVVYPAIFFKPLNKLHRFLTLLTLILTAPAAWGDAGQWFVMPSVVYTDDDGDRLIDDSLAGGQLNFGHELTDHFALEGLLGYSDIRGYPGQEHLELGFNAIGRLFPEFVISPYALAGLGYLDTETTTGITDNRATANLGLGFRLRFGDSRVSLRGEYRARIAMHDNGNLTDRIGTLGVEFRFGYVPRPVISVDGDGDGVPDSSDQCPGTPRATEVETTGCERDSDSDGVVNRLDQCPNSPPGAAVGVSGCQRDSDADGVPDATDRCPSTLAGVIVNPAGCEPDDDRDTIVNRLDSCPGTPRDVRVDVHGCEILDVIKLPGVSFESNSDRLLPGTEMLLEEVAATLRRHPDLEIVVAGHTDSDGSAEHNLSLSARRAGTVRDFLISAGVAAGNLTAVGFGESEPVADNATAAGKSQNRRVELRVLNR